MYVEDALLIIAQHDSVLDDWHQKFVHSVATQIAAGGALSTRQATVIVKLIQHLRHHDWLKCDQLDDLLRCPEYRAPPYESYHIAKEVRYLGNNFLAFRFKANDGLRERIKALGTVPRTHWFDGGSGPRLRFETKLQTIEPRFDWLYKIWIVAVYPFNLTAITDLINEDRFAMDGATFDYLALCRRSFDQPSLFTVEHTNGVILANVCDHPILAAWITEVAEGIPL